MIPESEDYYVSIRRTGTKQTLITTYTNGNYTNRFCSECGGRGIFYFTKDERLQDSQVCGECHGKGWLYD